MTKKGTEAEKLSKLNEELKREIEKRRGAENALKQGLSLLRKKNSIEKITNTVIQSVHKSIDPSKVMENAVHNMSKIIENAENISIYLVEGKEAILQAHRGYPESFLRKASVIPYPKGFTWEAIKKG